MNGTKLGVISGDLYTAVWNPKLRLHNLSILLSDKLKLQDLKFAVKSIKSAERGWELIAFAHGSGLDKRKALKALKNGLLEIHWEGWTKTVKIASGEEVKLVVEGIAKGVVDRIYNANLQTDG